MPDWQKLVRRHLALLLDAAEKDEIHAELAAHLEDAYESMLRDGIKSSEAAKRTLGLARDWQDLRRKITLVRSGEDTMTNRVTQLWLPGLATFLLSTGILAVMQILRLRPWILAKKRRFARGRALRLVVDSVAASRRHRGVPVMARGRFTARDTFVDGLSGAAVSCLDFSGASCESNLRQIYRPQHRADVSDFCSVWLGASSRGAPSRRGLTHTTSFRGAQAWMASRAADLPRVQWR